MVLVTRSNILSHQYHIPYLSSIDLILRPSIYFIKESSLISRHHLHVVDEVGPYLVTIIAAELTKLDRKADSGLKCFIHAIDKVCSENQNSLVVVEFAKKHFWPVRVEI